MADGGAVERGQRVHEARGEASEAAVAEPGLLLVLEQVLVAQADGAHRLAHGGLDAEVADVVPELRAHEVLGGEIDDGAVLAVEVRARRAHPAVQEPVADDVREREVAVVGGGDAGELGEVEEELPLEVVGDRRGVVAQRDVPFVDVVRLGIRHHASPLSSSGWSAFLLRRGSVRLLRAPCGSRRARARPSCISGTHAREALGLREAGEVARVLVHPRAEALPERDAPPRWGAPAPSIEHAQEAHECAADEVGQDLLRVHRDVDLAVHLAAPCRRRR